jgi:hypothetical protein
VLAKKLIQLKTDRAWVMRYPLFVAMVLGTCFLLNNRGLDIWLQLFIIIAVAGVGMFVCGFLPFRKIRDLVLNK